MSGERITAVLSTLTALAILGAGVVAQPSRTPKPVPAADRAASLESALRYQLELNSRHDRGASRDRLAELEQTLTAWQVSPKSTGDAALLEAWLGDAISRSLPNRLEPLPAPPAFSATEVPAPEPIVTHQAETMSEQTTPPAKPGQAAAPTAKAESKPEPQAPTPVIAKKEIIEPKPSAPPTPPAPITSLPAVAVESIAAPETIADPAPHSSETTAVAPPEPVSINLSELNARIRGYHDGQSEIVAAIVAAGDQPTLAQATRLTRQAVQLAEQRRFLQLYYESLTDRERQSVAEPRSMKETIDLVAKFVSSVELPAAVDDFLAAAEETDPRDELLESLHAATK